MGGSWGLGGVDAGAAMISLKAIRILLFHYNSNHQEPPDEIFIRDLRIQAFFNYHLLNRHLTRFTRVPSVLLFSVCLSLFIVTCFALFSLSTTSRRSNITQH